MESSSCLQGDQTSNQPDDLMPNSLEGGSILSEPSGNLNDAALPATDTVSLNTSSPPLPTPTEPTSELIRNDVPTNDISTEVSSITLGTLEEDSPNALDNPQRSALALQTSLQVTDEVMVDDPCPHCDSTFCCEHDGSSQSHKESEIVVNSVKQEKIKSEVCLSDEHSVRIKVEPHDNCKEDSPRVKREPSLPPLTHPEFSKRELWAIRRNELLAKQGSTGLTEAEANDLKIIDDCLQSGKDNKKGIAHDAVDVQGYQNYIGFNFDAEEGSGDDDAEDSDNDSDDDSETDSYDKFEDDSGDYVDEETHAQSQTPNENAVDTSTTTLIAGALYATDEAPKRRSPPKNPREYMARMVEMEDEKRARQDAAQSKKRKGDEQSGNPRKTLKLTNGRKHTESNASSTGEPCSVMHTSSSDAPVMPAFHATTHKAQMAKILECIPEGCDTRRTSSQKKDLDEARQIFGFRKIQVVDGGWRLKGMNTCFKNYQLTAASWMMKRECGRMSPYGGIIADGMGMGKTFVALSCIQGNPPDKADIKEFSKATLVLVPNTSTANQWVSEVEKHCKSPIAKSVAFYSAAGKLNPKQYARNWVVVATYSQLRSQLPQKHVVVGLEEAYEGDEEGFQKAFKKQAGGLFKIGWYRVILDEAHELKNRKSQTASACWHLEAKYRWALSGTPVSNNTREFYPYLKFLRCSFTSDFEDYSEIYVKGDDAQDNFEVLISLCTYRRRTDDTFLGCRIIDLPPSTSHDVWFPLSQQERIFHECLATFFQQNGADDKAKQNEIEEAAKELGDDTTEPPKDDEQQSSVWTIRQAVAHPFAAETTFRRRLGLKDIQAVRKALNETPKELLTTQLRRGENYDAGLSKYSMGLEELESSDHPTLRGDFDMDTLLEMVENEHEVRDQSCVQCHTSPPRKAMTPNDCDHFYCEGCLMSLVTNGSRGSRGRSKVKKNTICLQKDCPAKLSVDDSTRYSTLDCVLEDAANDSGYKEPGRDSHNGQVARPKESNGFFTASYFEPGLYLPSSSKLSAAMAVILTWLNEAPDDKIIVFTQFIAPGKAMGRLLEVADIDFLYYFGTTSQRSKDRALEAFKADSRKKVLLAGLRCGGQSLTLTVANRVIIIDPWWNKSVDDQAFARVQRMGQTKPTHLVRLWAEDTIDATIHEMQVSKAKEVGHALQDDGHVPKMLSKSKLEDLFAPKSKATKKGQGKGKR